MRWSVARQASVGAPTKKPAPADRDGLREGVEVDDQRRQAPAYATDMPAFAALHALPYVRPSQPQTGS